ncbi:phage tail protein [Kordiimonas sp. SCSIO 12603]|uniref:phage tail protein n=1 Tax=Kordiimonas sp. SCSIO 12603 TaxID=2829596 RepID=UPI0021048B6A|nr:tail fiber protein [Kordiimonas sp. SCSIO 12603]UTW59408.1 phage tail protein [Kordiimonas sp. SCSIO 12603]
MSLNDGTIGEVRLWAGNFAPKNWAFCDGQVLRAEDNQMLFSVIGATYGGDGFRTFALPDMRGRVAIGTGTGPGLSQSQLGGQRGVEAVTLSVEELPAHAHQLNFSTTSGVAGTDGPPATFLNTASTMQSDVTGGGRAHENMQPSLGLNYIICTEGHYPERS